MPEHGWILLNVPMLENTWINCFDYARVLNMLWYCYKNIITVTNAVKLEFLSTQIAHRGALLPFYIF